jgi:hypothetical protein
MDTKEWSESLAACAVALDRFLYEARRTQRLLRDVRDVPVKPRTGKKLLAQRSIEVASNREYEFTREGLFALLFNVWGR